MNAKKIIETIMSNPPIDTYNKEDVKKQIIYTIDRINKSAEVYNDYILIASALNKKGYIEKYAQSKNYVVDHIMNGKEDTFSYCNIPYFDIFGRRSFINT